MKLIVVLLLSLLIILEIFGAFIIERSHSKNNKFYLLLGVLAYTFVGLTFYFFIKYGKSFAVMNAIWQGSNIIVLTLLSYFILKEKLSRIQIIGIFFTFIGIILVDLPKDFISL